MLIIAGATVSVSLDRFEINSYKKMTNDIELLEDQIANYYLTYQALPILRDSNTNNKIKYTNTLISDTVDYYIIDLSAMSGISLNYGIEGYENPNTSSDVYVIELNTHNIYYVKGIELNGNLYHSKSNLNGQIDNSRLTTPKIEIIEGEKNELDQYTTEVTIKFIPGIHKTKQVTTTYTIQEIDSTEGTNIGNAIEGDISTLTDNLYILEDNGTFEITVTSETLDEEKSSTCTITSTYQI